MLLKKFLDLTLVGEFFILVAVYLILFLLAILSRIEIVAFFWLCHCLVVILFLFLIAGARTVSVLWEGLTWLRPRIYFFFRPSWALCHRYCFFDQYVDLSRRFSYLLSLTVVECQW